MKYTFELDHFVDSTFEIEISILTGKIELWKDGELCERSTAKGKPFLIPDATGEILHVYLKSTFPDSVPIVEINGIKYTIVEKLPWYQYAIALLPIILLFIGGALGGAIGMVSAMYNFQIFRSEGSQLSRYLKVIGVAVLAYFLYVALAALLVLLVN